MKRVYILLIIVLSSVYSHAQELRLPSNHYEVDSTCSGFLYDSGGPDSTYENYSNGSITIYPDEPNKFIMLTFSYMDLSNCCDKITFYNGDQKDYSNNLGTYYETVPPDSIYSSGINGALTLDFYSNSYQTGQGFEAQISCLTELPPVDLSLHYFHGYYGGGEIVAGRSMRIEASLRNNSSYRAGGDMKIFLSADTVISDEDELLYTESFTLQQNQYDYETFDFTLPSDNPGGDYYIIGQLMPPGDNNDSNLDNNTKIIPVTIIPGTLNIVAEFTSEKEIYKTPSSSYINVQYINRGNTNVDSVHYKVWLSVDHLIDGSDTLLAEGVLLDVDYLMYKNKGIYIEFPSDDFYPKGIYYLIMELNYESDSVQNNALKQIMLSPNDIDVSITSSARNSSFRAGMNFLIDNSITYAGDAYQGNARFKVFLSDDHILNESEDILLQDTLRYISYGYMPQYVYLDDTLSQTEYQIFVKISEFEGINEINLENNTDTFSITLSGPEYDFSGFMAKPHQKLWFFDESIRAYSTIINEGNMDSDTLHMQLVLSKDQIPDENDSVLAEQIYFLTAGATANLLYNSPIPAGIDSGKYYLILNVDSRNKYTESDEVNNISIHEVILSNTYPDVLPDFEILNLELWNDSAYKLDDVSYNFMVTNHGGKYLNNLTYGFYLSNDKILDENDINLSYKGEYYTKNMTWDTTKVIGHFAIPENAATGKKYVIIKADAYNVNFELDESNNIGIDSIYLKPEKKTSVYLINDNKESIFFFNTTYQIRQMVKTTGGYIYPPQVTINYYISDDDKFSPDDAFLSDTTLYTKNAGYSFIFNAELFFPDTLSSGFYYLVSEMSLPAGYIDNNATDNVVISPVALIDPVVDYSVSDMSTRKSSYFADEVINCSLNIGNNGYTKPVASFLSVYASTDDILDVSGDILVHQSEINHKAGSNENRHISFSAPGYAPSYYFFAVVDAAEVIDEENELNNYDTLQINILPSGVDLTISHIRLNMDTVLPGAYINGDFRVYNSGNTRLGESSIAGVYFSSDTILDGGDQLLTTESSYSLYPGDYDSEYMYTNIPANIPKGDYYILIKADHNSNINELFEDNNIGKFKITVVEEEFDLYIENMEFDAEVIAGESFYVRLYLRNDGNATPTNIKLGIYLSIDSALNKMEDALLGTKAISYLSSSGYTEVHVTLPNGFPNGDYYLFILADPEQLIKETDENNNAYARKFKISEPRTDISLSFEEDKNYLLKGGLFDCNVVITNLGNNFPDRGYNISFYLSDDTIYQDNDTFLGTFTNWLSYSPVHTRNYQLIISDTLENGNYYLLAEIQLNDPQYQEVDMENNFAYSEVEVSEGEIDFSITAQNEFTYPIEIDHHIYLNCRVYNNGNIPSYTSVNYYLSRDTVFDDSDRLLASEYTSTITPGNYRYFSSSYYVDTHLNGSYYILYVVNPLNETEEAFENNNMVFVPIEIQGPEYDYDYGIHSASGSYVPHSELFDSLTLSYTVTRNSISMDPLYGDIVHVQISSTDDSLNNTWNEIIYFDSIAHWDGYESYRYINVLVEKDKVKSQLTLKIVTPDSSFSNNQVVIMPQHYEDNVPESNLTLNYATLNNTNTSPGGLCTLNFGIENSGMHNINQPDVGIYLSSDNLISNDDIFLEDYKFSKLYPGDIGYGVKSFIIPQTIDTGYYYIITKADFQERIPESNEADNISVSQIHVAEVLENFVGISITLENTSVMDNSYVNYQGMIVNESVNMIEALSMGIYLSSDEQLDESDLILDTISTYMMTAYDSVDIAGSIQVPAGTTAGNYYLIFCLLEYDDKENESGHNMKTIPVEIDNSLTIGNPVSQQAISLYPNPADDYIHIVSDKHWDHLLLYDASGKMVQAYRQHVGELTLNLQTLQSGEYILKFIDLKNQRIYVRKIIKK